MALERGTRLGPYRAVSELTQRVPATSPSLPLVATAVASAILTLVLWPGRSYAQDDGWALWAEFGVSVALEAGTIFVAESPKQDGQRGPGVVHLFQRQGSTWIATGALSVPESKVEDRFGISMAVDGDTLAVGAQFADVHGEDSGLAYVFERRGNGWQRVAVLSPDDGAAGDQFGMTVSIAGDTVAVGARLKDDRGRDAGAAYVFDRRDGAWREVAKLTASDPAPGDLFGRVSLDSQALVVSADLSDDRGENAGKGYVFEKSADGWREVARLYAADATAGDELGLSLALSGDTLVLGAVGVDSAGRNSGAAYVFEQRDGAWSQVAKLEPRDPGPQHWFGASVAVEPRTVVIGAPHHGGHGDGTGAAYVFERREDTWTEIAKLTAADPAALTWFGNAVALSGGTVVIGVHMNSDGANRGAAYVFERDGSTWSSTSILLPPNELP